jgi:quercetin dioxygenase-like cupin family protein
MLITDISQSPRHRAPIPGGPTAAMLTPEGSSSRLAAIHVEIPAGGGMPEHDHGPSEILLIPLSGPAELRHGDQVSVLPPGTAAHIARGERVSLANPGLQPVTLMVVASPPDFASRLASWPAA